VLGGPVDRGLAHDLSVASGGNVLLLRELVRGVRAEGQLRRESGRRGLDGPLVAPARVRELIEERLAHLEGPVREALGLVALAEPAPMDWLDDLIEPQVLEQLEDEGLIELDDDARAEVRCRHPLYGEVA